MIYHYESRLIRVTAYVMLGWDVYKPFALTYHQYLYVPKGSYAHTSIPL
jgi:hypothetical protein